MAFELINQDVLLSSRWSVLRFLPPVKLTFHHHNHYLDMALALAEALKGQRNAKSTLKNITTKYTVYKIISCVICDNLATFIL